MFCSEEIKQKALLYRFCGKEQNKIENQQIEHIEVKSKQRVSLIKLINSAETNNILEMLSYLNLEDRKLFEVMYNIKKKDTGTAYFHLFTLGLLGRHQSYIKCSYGTMFLLCCPLIIISPIPIIIFDMFNFAGLVEQRNKEICLEIINDIINEKYSSDT